MTIVPATDKGIERSLCVCVLLATPKDFVWSKSCIKKYESFRVRDRKCSLHDERASSAGQDERVSRDKDRLVEDGIIEGDVRPAELA